MPGGALLKSSLSGAREGIADPRGVRDAQRKKIGRADDLKLHFHVSLGGKKSDTIFGARGGG